MSRLGYNLLPLDNLVGGLLREDKSHRPEPRAVDKWFICERCNGQGHHTSRTTENMVLKSVQMECALCKGLGRIQLRMTVERIS